MAVLHMSWTQFNQSGSSEVERLTQLSSTDLFRAAEAFFTPGLPWVTSDDRLWVKRRSSWVEPNAYQRSMGKGPKLFLPWKTTDQQDCFWYLFGIVLRFNWINFDVWLKQGFSDYLSRPKLSLGSAHLKYSVDPGLRPFCEVDCDTYCITLAHS